MARIFTFDCECGYQTAKRVEYTPSSNVEQVGEARFRVDFNKPAEHDGYPDQTINCSVCDRVVHGKKMQLWEAPPLYFNYLSHEDDD